MAIECVIVSHIAVLLEYCWIPFLSCQIHKTAWGVFVSFMLCHFCTQFVSCDGFLSLQFLLSCLIKRYLSYYSISFSKRCVVLIGCWRQKPSVSAQWAPKFIFISWSIFPDSICGNDHVITLWGQIWLINLFIYIFFVLSF